MAEHTPTTETVRERFIDGAINRATATGFSVTRYIIDKAREDFDRWLAEVKAEALREAAETLCAEDKGHDRWYADWLEQYAARIARGEGS